MKLTFCGGAQTVTGSSFLLEAAGQKILLDCGMFQGNKHLRARNFNDFPYNPAEIDFVILSHAHIDHSGLIPRLVKGGFRGHILATSATVDLVSIMLPDSAYIQEMEAEWQNRKNLRAGRPLIDPLYTREDAEKALKRFKEVNYYQKFWLSDRIALTFYNSGHILGSAITELTIVGTERTEKIVFTGDLGKAKQPIIKDPDILEEADYVVIESTYGTREHEIEDQKIEILQQVIQQTILAQGNVVIPSFAVGRTQELLYFLSRLMRDHQIPNLPIYIDSPLAISATEIFTRHPECYDLQMRELLKSGQDPFNFPEVIFTKTAEESKLINKSPGGAIIISASGMADAGRIKHHLKHNLWRPESTVLFVGYQAEGTLGRRIRDGARIVKIFGEDIKVNARIVSIDGFSAHADRSELLRWLGRFPKKPQQVFLVHGEENVLPEYAALIERELNLNTYIPEYLETVELTTEAVADKRPELSLRQTSAKTLQQLWQDFQRDYSKRLELAILEGDAELELQQLATELAEMRALLENE
ncbi:MAG TPA: MBL fold metallo-hydrolase [Oscillospiraceae bacterium]|nr:MBL fold metallo-hydrolase [Oscillospiraceae bacterium]